MLSPLRGIADLLVHVHLKRDEPRSTGLRSLEHRRIPLRNSTRIGYSGMCFNRRL